MASTINESFWCWREGSSATSFRNPVVDEEGMRPGRWLEIRILFSDLVT